MIIAIMLVALLLSRGAHTVGLKFAQGERVSTMAQSVAFVTIFSAVQAIILLFIPPYRVFVPDIKFYIYPLGFAMFYSLSNVMLMQSLKHGSASIANTIGSFNSLIVVAFSVIFLSESVRPFQWVGLALFIVGLLLYNRSSYSVGEVHTKVSVKFMVCVLLYAGFSGCAVIFTKLGMAAYPDLGKEYLLYYTIFSTILGIIIMQFIKPERGFVKGALTDKKFLASTALASLGLDINNLLFVSYINAFATAAFLPSFSVIGMIGAMLASRVILKERISKSAMISSVICVVAVLCLNL